MSGQTVIVGGGHAAVQLCLALRKEKYTGDIVLCSDEPHIPYQRPPLSKAYITGEFRDEKLPLRPESFYTSRNIDLRLNSVVTSIDTKSKAITSTTGDIAYQHLVLALGAKARKLPLPGLEASGVFELRNLQDAQGIKQQLAQSQHIVVIGAGFIGLEVAAAIQKSGKYTVTVFDTASRVMGRAVAPAVSRWFEHTHRKSGIDINLGEGIREVVTNGFGEISGVISSNGESIPADMVLLGVGVEPHTALAEAAGLTCENGIVVDQFCRSSDDSIFAAGDCANHPNVFAGSRRIRLESIQNATDQARTISSVIASSEVPGVKAQPYAAVPWFWSDQGEHNLQMTGLSFDANQHVTRGEPDSGSFSVFHYHDDSLLAVDSVNAPRDHIVSRRLLTNGQSPSVEQAADISFDLKTLL
ncbi:MAG: NAD(P)/FAD-dependent oxidoreductase [Granulosicoccus sp.]